MVKKFNVKVNGKIFEVEVEETASLNSSTVVSSTPATAPAQPVKSVAQVNEAKPEVKAAPVQEKAPQAEYSGEGFKVAAPLPGVIVEVVVSEGQKVNKGDHLLTIEAMKMENVILAEASGTVRNILVKKGDTVEGDQLLLVIG